MPLNMLKNAVKILVIVNQELRRSMILQQIEELAASKW